MAAGPVLASGSDSPLGAAAPSPGSASVADRVAAAMPGVILAVTPQERDVERHELQIGTARGDRLMHALQEPDGGPRPDAPMAEQSA